jgi:hypothetical protein
VPAMPPKPRMAAMMAIIRKVRDQESIVLFLSWNRRSRPVRACQNADLSRLDGKDSVHPGCHEMSTFPRAGR